MATIYDRLISAEGVTPNIGGAFQTAMSAEQQRIMDEARKQEYLSLQQKNTMLNELRTPSDIAARKMDLNVQQKKIDQLDMELNPQKYPEYHKRKSFDMLIKGSIGSSYPAERALAFKWMNVMNKKGSLDDNDYVQLQNDYSTIRKVESEENNEILLRKAASLPTSDFTTLINEIPISEEKKKIYRSIHEAVVKKAINDLELKKEQAKRYPTDIVGNIMQPKGDLTEQINAYNAQIENLKAMYGGDSTTTSKPEASYIIPTMGSAITNDEAKKIVNKKMTDENLSKEAARKFVQDNYTLRQ